jgi:flagellar motor switch protein FliM
MINLCIPTTVVETAGSQFAHAWQRHRRELTETEARWRRELIGRVPVTLTPLIDTRLKVSDVLKLRPGEVLPLPRPAEMPLDVYVGGTRKLTGRLAAGKGRLKMLIEERCLPGSWGLAGGN